MPPPKAANTKNTKKRRHSQSHSQDLKANDERRYITRKRFKLSHPSYSAPSHPNKNNISASASDTNYTAEYAKYPLPPSPYAITLHSAPLGITEAERKRKYRAWNELFIEGHKSLVDFELTGHKPEIEISR